MRIQIRIRIQGAKPMWIHAYPGQAATKVEYLDEKYTYLKYLVGNRSKHIPTKVQKPFWKAGNQIYLLFLVDFLAPESGLRIPGYGSRTATSMSQDRDLTW